MTKTVKLIRILTSKLKQTALLMQRLYSNATNDSEPAHFQPIFFAIFGPISFFFFPPFSWTLFFVKYSLSDGTFKCCKLRQRLQPQAKFFHRKQQPQRVFFTQKLYFLQFISLFCKTLFLIRNR